MPKRAERSAMKLSLGYVMAIAIMNIAQLWGYLQKKHMKIRHGSGQGTSWEREENQCEGERD